MRLCHVCSEIIRKDLDKDHLIFGHYETIESFISAVDDHGCGIYSNFFLNLTP
jgi:hypothetical protein